ncbi:c-type cytochrome [Cyanobium gracile]|uniref:C-type cytochrome n=1 Tax=Cyanobium gracile UHCC 0281 TaxID=3110309 RepID=A0ABU5SVE3_9CYAN|nr:c-type cytochrome [Cyanobium gracile]MEA5442459.1 c-type cytochrome [Cyanobium gracile UHCC 0281]
MIRWRPLVSVLVALLLVLGLILPPPALGVAAAAFAVDPGDRDRVSLEAGGRLFEAHCAGCHVQGGNILRRNKTLKLAALERNGAANPEVIATIAAAGLGQMGGYGEALGDGGAEAVAAWVWQQAQAGWPRG